MFAGIDVSKNWVDVALYGSEETLSRVQPLKAAKWLKKQGVTLVALEATGGYELPMVHALIKEKIAVSRINPRQVRQFGEAVGQRGKTDRLDAKLLARYAAVVQPSPVVIPAKEQQHLRALCMRRRELVAMRTQESNRLQQSVDAFVTMTIETMIEHLKASIKLVEKSIASFIAEHKPLKELAERLRTMPGIGPVTAAMLIAYLPELGEASRTEIAALAGIAPFARESGQWKGKSFCQGGRAPVREALYMAALSAVRGENQFRAKYLTLVDKGKPAKVALVAIMRKMLVILNALIANKVPFNA